MPKKDRRAALTEIKSHSNFKNISVMILTTSQANIDIRRTYDLGANFIIENLLSMSTLVPLWKVFKYWIHTVKLP